MGSRGPSLTLFKEGKRALRPPSGSHRPTCSNPGRRFGGRERPIPLTGGSGRKCSLSGRPREQRSQREAPTPFVHTSLVLGRPTLYTHRIRPWICPSLPPTSDDQVLQGSPSIGEVPLLACLPERGRDPILVGQDLAVLEGSRHYYDCGWGLGGGARWLGPPKARCPFAGLLFLAHSCPLVAASGLRPRLGVGSRRRRLSLARSHCSESGREQVVLRLVYQPASCPPYLQVFQSLVHDTWVREAASPERSEVGWIKLLVLLSIFKVIVKPGTFLLIP